MAVEIAADRVVQVVLADVTVVVLDWDCTAVVVLVVFVVAAQEIVQETARSDDCRFDVVAVDQLILVDQIVVVVVDFVIVAATVYLGYKAEVDHLTLAVEVQHCCPEVQLVDID